MRLDALAASVPGARITGDGTVTVRQIAHDSRSVKPGALFVAIRGFAADGNDFVDHALKQGAVAIASEHPPREGVAWVQVDDSREALAILSAELLGRPADALTLVGVTGTNGKTTPTYLIEAALRECGRKAGLIGTIQYRIGGSLWESERTTPESSDLQSLFARMREASCSHAVLEVSSHSLALKRVFGSAFAVGVFTNLTRDHLDFHGDMDKYFAAKRLLFDTYLRPDGVAVVNADDEKADDLRQASRSRVLTYGISRDADVHAEDLQLTLDGARFTTRTPAGDIHVATPLLGRFNVHNILAAMGASIALGLPLEAATRGITSVRGIPGRMERVATDAGFAVIVDYAHTDDALRKLLETVRDLKPRRVITVFGCGGDRDRTKRPLMGAVAGRLSDVVVITSDNPRSEPPEAIIEEIRKGIDGGSRAVERYAIVDRRDAIAKALEVARAGDAVVLAGKGHETYQVVRDRQVPFDDRQVARDILHRLADGRRAKA